MMKEINKDALRSAIDFSDLEDEIEEMAPKCFEHWLNMSLKDAKDESEPISPVTGKLVVDFKNAVANAAMYSKRELSHTSNNEFMKATIVGRVAGHLEKKWNKEYLVSTGKKRKRELTFLEFVNSCFDASSIGKFVKKNINILPKTKPSKSPAAYALVDKILSKLS